MFKLSIALFGLLGLGLFVLGCIYLATNQFMPYHAQALQADWSDLAPNYRGLILGLIRGLGAGAFIAGGAILFMAGSSLKWKSQQFQLLLPLVAVGYSSLLCYATYTVQMNTPANPPLNLIILGVVVSLLGSATLLFSSHSKPSG